MAAYELKKSIAKVGKSPSNFALYKGEDTDQIVVGSSAPTPAVIKEITKECGKVKVALKGLCFREGDLLVFATKLAPAPQWKMQLAKILKERKCQGASNIELRQLGPDDADSVEGEEGGEEEVEEGGGEKMGGGKGGTATLTKPTTTKSATTKPAVTKQAVPLAAQWNAARDAAMKGVTQLIAKLQATGDPEAAKASKIVQQIAAGFPAGLDAAFAGYDKAKASKDPKQIAAAQAQAKAQADSCLGYLNANQKVIGLCEANPFGASVAISKPLAEALNAITARMR